MKGTMHILARSNTWECLQGRGFTYTHEVSGFKEHMFYVYSIERRILAFDIWCSNSYLVGLI
jgi:hypothetical protein